MVDTSAADLGNALGMQSRRTSEIEEQGFGSDPGAATLFTPIDGTKIRNDRVVVTKKEIGTAFILGHPVNGELGNNTFTLGAGGLGPSTELYIAMSGQTFQHNFLNTTFVNQDETTATLLTGSCLFSTDGEDIFQPVTLHKEEGASITAVRIDTVSTDNANLHLEANTGSGWETVTQGVSTAVTAGSTLDVRIRNDIDTSPSGWPTPWGTWGASGSYDEVTLTQVRVNYTK